MNSIVTTYALNHHLVCEIRSNALTIFNFNEISSLCSNTLKEHGVRSVIVDLGKVEMIDSVGVGLLARMKKHLEEKGARMSICCVTEGVHQVFKLLDFHRRFEIYSTVHEAAA